MLKVVFTPARRNAVYLSSEVSHRFEQSGIVNPRYRILLALLNQAEPPRD